MAEFVSNDFTFALICVVVAASLLDDSSISDGFSDEDKVNLTLTIDCDFSGIEVSIHANKTDFSKLTLQCDDKNCDEGNTSAKYGLTNRSLDVSFPYRHSDHGGKYINFRTTCKNQTNILDHALLKPCRK